MTDYSLTVTNASDENWDFCVFATLPTTPSYASLRLAWLVQQIDNGGNSYKFTWSLDYSFVWAAQGVAPGYNWSAAGHTAADPNSGSLCAVTFHYDGDWSFLPASGTPDGSTLTVMDDPTVPEKNVKPSSVGIAIGGSPASVLDAGPNLKQVFTLHPTYYLAAGQFVPGDMIDAADLTMVQTVEFANTQALSYTLQADNTWSPGAATAELAIAGRPARR